ncbi:MAG: PfkB family carbohydrate kinase [Chitinophagales bacterium]|nr:PfkB family carbohydrate kinase [Chitinophagales bacterium]
MNYSALFKDIEQLTIGIVGDVMLDTYMWGNVDRISPEAPVPIVALKEKEFRIGGAANVALNTVSLKASTHIFSVIGKDDDGKTLINLLQKNNIQTNGIIQSQNRITTNKIRVIARNQQMMRLDSEIINDIDKEESSLLLQQIEQFIIAQKPAIIILQDYNKGVLTDEVIKKTIALCKEYNILTAVDPKRKNFFSYIGVDIFKPNLKEIKDALNIITDSTSLEHLKEIHKQLQEKLQHKISFITLSDKGVFYNSADDCTIIQAHIRHIADVSGAGDTVIAVASLIYATTKNMKLAAEIANIAGGLVCEEVGTAAINKNVLEKEVIVLLS